jgi:hypothetical protein
MPTLIVFFIICGAFFGGAELGERMAKSKKCTQVECEKHDDKR